MAKDMGTAIFKAIADFAQVRREARQTERELAQLRHEAERPIHAGGVDKKSDFLSNGKAGGVDFAKGFLKGVGKLAIAAPVIGGAGAGALAGAASLLSLAASMQAVAGAGIAIPGVFAGITVATKVLGMNIEDGKNRLQDIGVALADVNQSSNNNFWYFAEKPIRGLVKQLLPEYKDGIENIGWAWGEMAAQTAKSSGEALGGGKLGGMLNTIRTAIDRLTPAIDPVVKGLVAITDVGIKLLPKMADKVAALATKWGDWVQAAAADGRLQKMLDDGLNALQDIWTIAKSAFEMVGALIKAAQGSGATTTLHGLAVGIQKVADAMNGPVFQKALSTIFEGANKGGAALADSLGKIGDAFVRGAPALGKFLELGGQILGLLIGGLADAISNPAFGAGLNTFMEGLKAGVELLVPLLPGFSAMIGGLLASLAPFVAAVVPFLPAIAVGFVAWKSAMAGWALGEFIAGLGPLAAGIGSAATAAWGFTAALLANPITWVVLAIVALVAALIWFFTQTDIGREIWGGFVNWLTEVVNGFLNWWNGTAVPWLQNGFAAMGVMIATFWGIWTAAWNAVWAVIQFIIALIVNWILTFVTNVMTTLAVLGMLGQMAFDWFMGILNSILSVGAAIFGFVASIPGTIIGWLVQLAVLGAMAFQWFMGMVTSAMDAGGQLLAWVAGLPGQVLSFLGDLGGLLIGAGQSLIQGFIDGIQGMVGAVGDAVGGVMDFIGSFFPHSPAKRGAFSGKGWTPYRGKAVMTGFAEGIMAGQATAEVAASDGMVAISNKLNPTINGSALLGATPAGLGGDVPPVGGATAPPPPPAPAGGGGLTVVVNNPAPEAPSTSIQKTYQKIAYLGLDAKEGVGV